MACISLAIRQLAWTLPALLDDTLPAPVPLHVRLKRRARHSKHLLLLQLLRRVNIVVVAGGARVPRRRARATQPRRYQPPRSRRCGESKDIDGFTYALLVWRCHAAHRIKAQSDGGLEADCVMMQQ